MSTPKVFISHSHGARDAALVEAIEDLIRSAIVLPREEIFCASRPRQGLAPGAIINPDLLENVRDAEVFLVLISSASMASPYVWFEVGARWESGGDIMPLLAPGVSPEILRRSPLASTIAKRCDLRSDLQAVLDQVAKLFSREPLREHNYQKELDAVLRLKYAQRAESLLETACPGFLHLRSKLFNEVSAEVRSLIDKRGVIPTKYLFTHAEESLRYYDRLVKNVKSYNAAARATDLFTDHVDEIARELSREVAVDRSLTIVSLGIGHGEKEVLLLDHLGELGVSVRLFAVDINPAYIHASLIKINNACARLPSDISCKFWIGDFDHVEHLSSLLPDDGAILFLALSGILGNQNESMFLRGLQGVCGERARLLMDFQTISSLGDNKGGYGISDNLKFVSAMFTFFGEPTEADQIEALYDDESPLEKPISVVPGSRTIVMARNPKPRDVKKDRLFFGYSTRYDYNTLCDFLGGEGWSVKKTFPRRRDADAYLFLCQCEPR